MLRRTLSAVLLASTATGPAFADPACLEAYDGSQRSRRDGKLLEARAQLVRCAQEQCPSAVATQCTAWLREVDQSLPTVVFAVRDAAGKDVSEARVTSQGQLLAERLDGRAVALDPGRHTVRFELPDGRKLERTIVVRQGEKNRLIEIQEPPPPAPVRTAKPSAREPVRASEPDSIPTLAIVLGAVGVLALGSFAYFAYDAKTDVDDMDSRCAPDCKQSEVDTAERKALVADISLGVGVLALAGAGVVFFTRSDSNQGAFVGMGGRF